MKIFAKFLIIISLAAVVTGCDWLQFGPTYYDEEWVVEKVECIAGSKYLKIYIKAPIVLSDFEFFNNEKLTEGFYFHSICTVGDINVVSEETFSTIIFYVDKTLDSVTYKTIQFDTTKIFYKTETQVESWLSPSKIWRCRITTPSIDISYIDPGN